MYEKIVKSNDDMAKAHFEEYLRQKIIFNRSPFKCRSKLPHITFYGESPEMKDFYLEKVHYSINIGKRGLFEKSRVNPITIDRVNQWLLQGYR